MCWSRLHLFNLTSLPFMFTAPFNSHPACKRILCRTLCHFCPQFRIGKVLVCFSLPAFVTVVFCQHFVDNRANQPCCHSPKGPFGYCMNAICYVTTRDDITLWTAPVQSNVIIINEKESTVCTSNKVLRFPSCQLW